MLLEQKEPISTVRDIAGDATDSGNIYNYSLCLAVRRDVYERYRAIRMQVRRDDTDGRLDAVFARLDAAEVRERCDQPDGSVSAHADAAGVIKKNYTRGARSTRWLDEQRADQHIGAARLGDHPAP